MKIMNTQARLMGAVPRWVIVPTIQNQTVAEHSYFVTLYVMELCEFFEWGREQTLDAMSYAMMHDISETFTGDIPSTVRRNYPHEIVHEENCKVYDDFDYNVDAIRVCTSKDIVKLADCLEAWAFIQDEKRLGNRGISEVEVDVRNNLDKALENMNIESQFGAFHQRFMGGLRFHVN